MKQPNEQFSKCLCGRKPDVNSSQGIEATYVECVNRNCLVHLTVAAGNRTQALAAWNAALAALAAQEASRA